MPILWGYQRSYQKTIVKMWKTTTWLNPVVYFPGVHHFAFRRFEQDRKAKNS